MPLRSLALLLIFCAVIIGGGWFGGCGTTEPPPPNNKPDTTSHDFTWQTYTLGDGNSVLYDVAIINDTLAYAVGEVYLKDSVGHWENLPYGLAIWNGHSWQLKKLYYRSSGSRIVLSNIRGIWYSNPSEICFAAGSVFRWDGVSDETQLILSRLSFSNPSASIEKLWGNAESIYGVGNAGTIVHSSNGSWRKIESGTTLPIQDVYGAMDDRTGEQVILCVASDKYFDQGKKLLRIHETTISTIADSGLSWSLGGVWFDPQEKYYVVGGGIFTKSSLAASEQWQIGLGLTPYYTNAVRGNGSSDVVVAGAFGALLHYNGSTWKNYTGNDAPQIDGTYFRIAIKNDLVCAVGVVGNRAAIIMGKRN